MTNIDTLRHHVLLLIHPPSTHLPYSLFWRLPSFLLLHYIYSSVLQVESSFLMCVVCCKTPRGPPLFGCSQNHLVCGHCRDVGGSLLSCPRCGSSDLSSRQVVAEELLETELKSQVELVSCPYKSLGCNKMTREQMMGEHKEVCVFRPVKCPKGMFSWSCLYIGPLITMQQHARDHHALHHGITVISPGFISSKMFDRSPDR